MAAYYPSMRGTPNPPLDRSTPTAEGEHTHFPNLVPNLYRTRRRYYQRGRPAEMSALVTRLLGYQDSNLD